MSFTLSSQKLSFFFQPARAMQSIKAGITVVMLMGLSLAACADPFSEVEMVHQNETVIVSTLAGGAIGNKGDWLGLVDGAGNVAQFTGPRGITIDAAGNLYVTDAYNHRIRKVTPNGEVSTIAGSGPTESFYMSSTTGAFADGEASTARFHSPSGIAIDTAGNLYVADSGNDRIRKITPNGEVSTLAGGGKYQQKSFADGEGSTARFYYPYGIAIDAADNLYVADYGNNRIRKVTPQGEVSSLAGGGEPGFLGDFADGEGNDARFSHPSGIAIDRAGNLYVADKSNHRIRKITPKGEVSTVAGSGPINSIESIHGGIRTGGFADGEASTARFYVPHDIAIDKAGNLYVADTYNNRIRKITPKGEVSTLAGGEEGFADGEGSVARFSEPSGITIDAEGNLYVADSRNNRIRKITIQRP